ncbi:kinesin-4 isoform X1 [Canna indica]|uniref:Kinesin-4 isoform X1 n=1 Tax=Canna indica TaxID=4628 RepID=A0AAQ3KNL1_9LILI|nr:kinesin-4 isoform X1 [Canna indica]
MASEGLFSISVASVVEDMLKQHAPRLSDIDLASRKEEEAALRRYEAAGWLRKTVGVFGARDLPDEPSEDEFRLGLRNGIVLCNALNKVQPAAVPKVVEAPADSALPPDGAALSAYQYFENVRNFLVALEELGLPTFETSDLERGGKGSRVVDSVLALKSYSENKQVARNGSSKYGGALKPSSSGKYFVRRNLEPFMNSLSRSQSFNKVRDGVSVEQNLSIDFSVESTEMASSHSLKTLVHTILSDKNPEEVPLLVESMLSKVMQEFEHRIACKSDLVTSTLNASTSSEDMDFSTSLKDGDTSKDKFLNAGLFFHRQKREIQELKNTLLTTRAGMELMRSQFHKEFSDLGKHIKMLAHAASGYHKVLEENRKLYNQVQDLKGNIRVYCRVRPFLTGQSSIMSTVDHIDDGKITIITPSKYGKEGRKSFNFNKVFGPSATQEEVFSDMQPLIRSVLDGYNVCIFAYGQTGSGKTYTMSGPKILTEESFGVNYRALNDLFHISKQRKDMFCYEIAVQMIEIYNEQVRDLLTNDGPQKRLDIHNSSQKGLAVPDASLVHVASTEEVIELMSIGQRNRAVSATAMNDRSSRSHSCVTIHVQGRDLTSGVVLRGCMHLVDLAGSERVNKSEAKGDRLKEAQHINKSLSALGDVISALAQKSSHVPYRNSKLTQLLQDSLGGQAKTLMFVHISPEEDAISETISTLKFAERVATVELGAAQVNKQSGEVKELRQQVAGLKSALAKKEGEHFRSIMSTPGIYKIRSGTSPEYPTQMQIVEDLRNIEVRDYSAVMQEKVGTDLSLLKATGSSHWPESYPEHHKFGNKKIDSGEWINKVTINKHEVIVSNAPREWDGDNLHMPDSFYQGCFPHVSVFSDQQKDGANSVATDDSDDLDLATSDSSDCDMLWQYNLQKNSNTINSGSRIKKPQSGPTRSHDIRVQKNSYIPSPSGKMLNSHSQIVNSSMRQLISTGIDGKRRQNGKTLSIK